MDYEDKLRYAILNGLMLHFGVSPIDIVCMSPRYQLALGGVERILGILNDDQKGALYLEFDSINIHHDKVQEIQDKIDDLKQHEFANADAIKAQEKKLHMVASDATKSIRSLALNLINMLNEFCIDHVQRNMNIDD